MINAHAGDITAGGTSGSIGGNSGTADQKTGGLSNSTVQQNTTAVENATKKIQDNTNKQSKGAKALEKFQKLFANTKDWIEVHLQRLEEDIEYNLQKGENSSVLKNNRNGKNDYVNNAMDIVRTERDRASEAETLYRQRANKVKNKAVSTGLLNKKRATTLLNKVMNGEMSIEDFTDLVKTETKTKKKNGKNNTKEGTSKSKTFIDTVTEWVDKMRDARQKVEELTAKLKELEQQKLDNIVEQFETLVGYAESLQGISDSFINLTTIKGQTAVNDEVFKREYDSQMEQQNFITGYLKNERNKYKEELNTAKDEFGVGSVEYNSALTKFNEMQQAIYESETKYYEMREKKAQLEFDAISQVVNRIKKVQQTLTTRMELRQARDNNYIDKGSADTSTFIEYNERQIGINNALIVQWKEQLDEATDYLGKTQMTNENAAEYQKYYDMAIDAENEILSIIKDQEELKKAIRELRWKDFEDLQKQIENSISDFDHLRELMRDAEWFDTDYGIEITDKGFANIALIANSMKQAKQQIRDYREALKRLDEDFKNGNIGQTEFNETSREYVEIIQNSAKAVAGYEDNLVSMYTTMIQNENKLLQDNINKRKEALQAKKSYYDWDRQLSQKNKDMAGLMAQINALEGVTNQAGQAKLTQLRAQLKDAQDDMDDTLYQHEIEVRQQGFDQLADDATEILNDTLQKIDGNQEIRNEIIKSQLELLNDKEDIAAVAIRDMIDTTGTVISEKADGLITNMGTLVTDAYNKNWEDNISPDITNLKTDIIPTYNDTTKKIEEEVSTDIENLTSNINTYTTNMNTQMGSIRTKLDSLIAIAAAEQHKKEEQEEKGEASSEQGQPANPTDNGGSIPEQVKDTPGVDVDRPPQPTYDNTQNQQPQRDPEQQKKWEEVKRALQTSADKTGLNYVFADDKYTFEAYTRTGKKVAEGTIDNGFAYAQNMNPLGVKQKDITDLLKNNKAKKVAKTAIQSYYSPLRNHVIAKFGYDIGDYKNNTITQKLGELFGISLPKTTTADARNLLYNVMNNAGFRKGAKSTDDELNWLHDSEVVIRKSDGAILQPFNAGDMVFTSKQSENLWKMSQIPLDKIKEMVANPDMSKFIQPGITDRVSTTENNNQQIHFDSLITINGNADHDTVMDLQQIASALINNRDFKKNLSNYVTKDLTREAAKSGFRGR